MLIPPIGQADELTCRFCHRAPDRRSSSERLMDKLFQTVIHLVAIGRKWQDHARSCVERHDTQSISGPQLLKSCGTGPCDPVYLGTHAPADIDEQYEVERLFAAREKDNRLFLTVVEHAKIVLVQLEHGLIVPVRNLRVDMDERDTRLERRTRLTGNQARSKPSDEDEGG
jgi:hypothetical protein